MEPEGVPPTIGNERCGENILSFILWWCHNIILCPREISHRDIGCKTCGHHHCETFPGYSYNSVSVMCTKAFEVDNMFWSVIMLTLVHLLYHCRDNIELTPWSALQTLYQVHFLTQKLHQLYFHPQGQRILGNHNLLHMFPTPRKTFILPFCFKCLS